LSRGLSFGTLRSHSLADDAFRLQRSAGVGVIEHVGPRESARQEPSIRIRAFQPRRFERSRPLPEAGHRRRVPGCDGVAVFASATRPSIPRSGAFPQAGVPVDDPRKGIADCFAPAASLTDQLRLRMALLRPALAVSSLVAAVGHLLSRRSRVGMTDLTERIGEADLNEERLWRLLGQGTITMQELREQGVRAPAQGLYELQLAGYVIDRHRVEDETGQSTLGYRLSRDSLALADQDAAPVRHHITPVLPPGLRSAER
jgi:hypothetical protein